MPLMQRIFLPYAVDWFARLACLNGLRAEVVQENGWPLTLIPTKTLNDFEAAFVSAATLALRLKTSPRHLAHLLQEEGVQPLTRPTVDGGRQTFFRTAGVATVSIFPGRAGEQELKQAS